MLRVDVHTHIWECPGHVGPTSVEENRRVFGSSIDLRIDPDEHDRVMREGTEIAVVDRSSLPCVPDEVIESIRRRETLDLLGIG